MHKSNMKRLKEYFDSFNYGIKVYLFDSKEIKTVFELINPSIILLHLKLIHLSS